MANEYGELEQLVNDVTNLDTARMTLRWALERLNSIEKERADLKKNLALAEETSKQLQVRLGTLEDSFRSRSKSLGEKEEFYAKLEATMSLLGEGKLDIQQFLKKEARLDQLRQSLENEYQDKFEELDRNQRSVIERWNARLLEVESQYAAKLAESQKKYDSLRSDLEADHQGRLLALQKSFSAREGRLTERIGLLETSAKAGESSLEDRKKELENEFCGKKRELEENYRKLKNLLERGLEEKLRATDSDHGEQIRSLELSWKTERDRLVEEQRVREEQFVLAQNRIKEVENLLASQQEAHHGELMKIISEKEAAFRSKLETLEKEKDAYSRTVAKMQEQLGTKEAQWAQEREDLNAELSRRLSLNDSSVRERAVALEKEYAAKKEELDRAVTVSRQEFEAEFEARMKFERLSREEEKNRSRELLSFMESGLKAADEKIKELETALASSSSGHQKELMERLSAGEAAFRDKLVRFEEEKKAYNRSIEKLADELKAKEEALLGEKARFSRELSERTAALQAQLSDKEKNLVLERENLASALEKVSAEAGAMAEKRTAEIRAQYEERKARLELEFSAKFSDRVKALEFDKARAAEAVAVKEAQLSRACEKTRELENAMEALKAGHSDEKSALERANQEKIRKLAEEFETERAGCAREVSLKEAAAKVQLETLREGFEQEREQFRSEIAAREEAVKAAGLQMDALKAETLRVKAGFESEFNAKVAELERSKEAIRREFLARKVEVEAGVAEQSRRLEEEYSAKKAELEIKFKEHAEAWHTRQDADYRSREEAWKLERERLMDSVASRDEELKLAQEKIRSVQGEMEAQFIAMEKASEEKCSGLEREFERLKEARVRNLEESWSKQRDAFVKELAARDALLRQISEETVSLREELAKSLAQKAHNSEEVIQLRAMDGKMREKCRNVEKAMENLKEETRLEKEEWRKNTEVRIRSLKEEWGYETQKQILYYQERMDKLVETCDTYRKELEAREEALRRREKK